MPAIGDRWPSQLLADLLEYCPPAKENTAFFRAPYMQWLPAKMQVLFYSVEDGDLKQLAQKADKLWAIRRPADSGMASVTGTTANDFGDAVAAVRSPFQKPDKKQPAVGRGQRKPRMYSFCYKHMKYGAAAHKCDDPNSCTWQ